MISSLGIENRSYDNWQTVVYAHLSAELNDRMNARHYHTRCLCDSQSKTISISFLSTQRGEETAVAS